MQKELEFKIELKKVLPIFIMMFVLGFTIYFENSYAEEKETIEIEVKYTNGDIVDYNSIKIVVYQDFQKDPILEKKLSSNSDFISVEENHRYKIEVYADGMYADVGYVQVNDKPVKITMNIPLSGGLQFQIFYKNGQVPIKDATVVLKSFNNSELRRAITNDDGETVRYWVQSTTKQGEHYTADVYFEDIFLTSYSPIKLLPGLKNDQKIITNIPEVVESLILINLYDGSKKIASSNGDYDVSLLDIHGTKVISSKVNFRGDAQFSNIKSGTYTVKINSNTISENLLWPETKIQIIGDSNKFNIFRDTETRINNEKTFQTCNCIAFRLDDVQDYWLVDTQIELIDLFAEKEVPLTVGLIGNTIGNDEKITTLLKTNIDKKNIEIANHSWDNEILKGISKEIQKEKILKTNTKIFELFGINPNVFIPPQNLYDENTVNILYENGFSHLISHVKDNSEIFIIDDLFYNIPAVTETGNLVESKLWELRDNDYIINKVSLSIQEQGYAIIMIHPQEFSINNQGEYGSPNQESISKLNKLLDEIIKIDAKIIPISEVKPNYGIGTNEVISNNTITQEDKIDTCNCIAFRLDDVQDYWLNDVQIAIMDTFANKNTLLTIGILANSFGNDQKITEFIKENTIDSKRNLEIATKGIGLDPFTNLDKSEQNKNLKESIELIESILNERPKIFIPPNNKFNSDTMEILEENNITHISSSLLNGDSPPFEFSNQIVYRFPLIASTGEYNPTQNIFEWVPIQQTMSEATQGINNYGFSVISLHPQEFSTIENSTYTNVVDENQINELIKLIDEINEKGYKIVPIGKINSNLIVSVPQWIKNNAGWWADGSMDDKTFVQGIEYLVKEKIIHVNEKSQTSKIEQSIPPWIKNNAGWWADGSMDDKTFVQGIEYLVKNGIILY
ncbi:MAG: polysaccharide deacetylase family protein [Candidatus Nitrosopumilus sp. bin_7KS]